MSHCGSLSFGQKTRNEAVQFWAINNEEHIEVLLGSAAGVGATLFPQFRQSLEALKRDFARIANEAANNGMDVVPMFLQKNRKLIKLLERLKFEGYNGYPVLYEATIHFIYEAEYAADAIKGMQAEPKSGQPNVLFTIHLRNMGIGNNVLECSYGQMYFWSLIGAQHPSLLMNVTPTEAGALPMATKDMLDSFISKFNAINYKLSNLHSRLNRNELLAILSEYQKTNSDFLRFLTSFKTSPTLVPYNLRRTLPPLFMGILNHIIHETQDALAIGMKIERALQ